MSTFGSITSLQKIPILSPILCDQRIPGLGQGGSFNTTLVEILQLIIESETRWYGRRQEMDFHKYMDCFNDST